jgi:hypothetical protein
MAAKGDETNKTSRNNEVQKDLGSCLRDALQEGSADAVACLPVPRAQGFSSFPFFAWWRMLLFLVRKKH